MIFEHAFLSHGAMCNIQVISMCWRGASLMIMIYVVVFMKKKETCNLYLHNSLDNRLREIYTRPFNKLFNKLRLLPP